MQQEFAEVSSKKKNGDFSYLPIGPSPRLLKSKLEKSLKDGGKICAFSEVGLRTIYEMLEYPDNGEFVTFPKLTEHVCLMLDIPYFPLASQGVVRESLRYAINHLPESPFVDILHYPGYLTVLQRLLHEFRMWNAPLQIECYSSIEDERLSQLLNIVCQVDSLQKSCLEKIGVEILSSRLRRCLDADVKELLEHFDVSFVHSSEVTPLIIDWLSWARERSLSGTYYYPKISNRKNMFQGIELLIGKSAECSDVKHFWYENLFTTEKNEKIDIDAQLFSTPDILAECEWVVHKCMEHTKGHVSGKRIGIYAKELESYAPLLRVAAERVGLPLRFCMRTKLVENTFVGYVNNLLKWLLLEDISSASYVINSSYSGINYEEKQFLLDSLHRSIPHNDSHQVLLDNLPSTFECSVWLKKIIEWGLSVKSIECNLETWIQNLRDLILIVSDNFFDENPYNRDELLERDQRACLSLIRSLTDYASIHTRDVYRHYSASKFHDVCIKVWEMDDVVYPYMQSGVTVTNNLDALQELDVLFVVGCLEGFYPKKRRENVILSDEDKQLVSETVSLVHLLPNSYDTVREERDDFIRICALPSEQILFSYPETSEDRDNIPAFYITEIERYLGRDLHTKHYTRLDGVNREKEQRKILTNKADEKDSWTSEFLAGKREGCVDVKELVSIEQCPFRAALKYGLDVREDATLQNAFGYVLKLLNWDRTMEMKSEEEARKMLLSQFQVLLSEKLYKLTAWEKSLLSGAVKNRINNFIKREFSARDLWRRKEKELYKNEDISEANSRNSITIQGEQITLVGTLPARYTTDEYTILTSFDNGYRYVSWDNDFSSQHLLEGILMLTQYGKNLATGIEVDDLNEKRYLLLLPKLYDNSLKSSSDGMLNIREVSDNIPEYYKQLRVKMLECWNQWKKGNMVPKKNDSCRSCAYHSLCRIEKDV